MPRPSSTGSESLAKRRLPAWVSTLSRAVVLRRSVRASLRCSKRRPISPMAPRWQRRRWSIPRRLSWPNWLISSTSPPAAVAAAPTIDSPGSKRINTGPWAVRPITGMVLSSMGRRSMRPVLLATAKSSPGRHITTRCNCTPSLSLSTVVARPDSSRRSWPARRLKRPSLLNKPTLKS